MDPAKLQADVKAFAAQLGFGGAGASGAGGFDASDFDVSHAKQRLGSDSKRDRAEKGARTSQGEAGRRAKGHQLSNGQLRQACFVTDVGLAS